MAEQKLRLSARKNQQLQNLILVPSVFTLVMLLCTACSLINGTPPPPEVGVLLTCKPDSPAADHLIDMPPVGVDQTQIENGIILTRLDVRIAPDATVAQINNALEQVNAGIVSMSSDQLFMTVAVPRQADFEALQELANTLRRAPGIRYAFPGREMVVHDWPFPNPSESESLPEKFNETRHLVPTRFPAAWNLSQRFLANCDPVPVLIADQFSGIPPVDFTSQVPRFPADIPGILTGTDDTNHGYYVTSVLAANFDDQPAGRYRGQKAV